MVKICGYTAASQSSYTSMLNIWTYAIILMILESISHHTDSARLYGPTAREFPSFFHTDLQYNQYHRFRF